MNLIENNTPYSKIFSWGENSTFFLTDNYNRAFLLHQNLYFMGKHHDEAKLQGPGHSGQGGGQKLLRRPLLTLLNSLWLKR